MPRLLAFMCHPDDAEILVGGTLLLLKSIGWEVGIATMTAGDCGSATHTREEISRIRLAEARSAADYLGASHDWAGLMDLEVFANAENLRKAVEVMRRFDPDAVLTHSPVDYIVDHEEASRLVRAASFTVAAPLYETRQNSAAPIARHTPALYYADAVEGVDLAGKRILPDFYVDITEQMERKRQLASCHASQREWLRSQHGMDEYLNVMSAWAAKYGQECGVAFAEGFRQHLTHAHPHEPLLQKALGTRVCLPVR